MANEIKAAFLQELANRFGSLKRLAGSRSLIDVKDGKVRFYIRYSAVHGRGKTFYGLREQDLLQLEGRPSFICFLWDGQFEPLLIPFAAFEEVFHSASPASDGQYKVQVFIQDDGCKLYIAKQGRFNIEAYFGWNAVEAVYSLSELDRIPEFSHSQIQTLLGSIGATKNFNVWIPQNDRSSLDLSLTQPFTCSELLPPGFETIMQTMQKIDVIWFHRGSNELRALFEVEHSTPIYSGLLRFNDIHLAMPGSHPRFSIVANDTRKALFSRQINRPTFQVSGLYELCTFLEYSDVYGWHTRIKNN